MISHPTQSCHVLKDTLQALIDAGILRLHPEQKAATLDTATIEDDPRPFSCNIICALLKDTDSDVPTLTDSDQEIIVLAAQAEPPLVAGTRSGQSYLSIR